MLAVRDRIVDVWMDVRKQTKRQKKKRVYYLSIEFLIGRLLLDTLSNLRLVEPARHALAAMGVDLDQLRLVEPDAALGNGGLGRLAACFMDSLSSLGIPAYGYGIRYENGLFEQRIKDGWQKEYPEDWLTRGNPWEFARSGSGYAVGFGGMVEYLGGDEETARAVWHPAQTVQAVPYDTPITGWRGRHVNALRLWSARAPSPIQLSALDRGDVVGATASRARSETISRVLYPNDATPAGQELRLRQEYFFTSASLQDITRRHFDEFGTLETLDQHAAVQLNDTHPAIAVAELMRILVDEHNVAWTRAWKITRATLSYTNHTLLPEALETWPADLIGRLLPRHLQIIYLINWFHLKAVERAGCEDPEFLANVSLVEENGDKRVRMGHLAFLGSHCVNGVSELHTKLLRQTVFHDLAGTVPTQILNKTNGITLRRWLYDANGALTDLLIETLGERVLDDPRCLTDLEPLAGDADFVAHCQKARAANKWKLAELLHARTGVRVPPGALFDVQIKRVHEYKRQLLNILEAVALYQAIRAEPDEALGAAGEDLRRQGGGELRPCQADHQAGKRRRQGGQCRSDRRRPAQSCVRAQLQRESRRSDHSGGRSVRADFHRRHGSLRHRQYEARAQRGAHHRHAGRRQYRDSRARRRRQYLYLRHDRGRSGGTPTGAVQRRRGDRGLAAPGGGGGEPQRRQILARRSRTLRAHRAIAHRL